VVAAEPIETLVFVFDAHAGGLFEGRLGAALERAEAGGALRIRDVLFVGREAQTGEHMVLRATGGTGGMVTALADFRMDAARRQGATATALASQDDGDTVREIAERLEPGASVIAVAVEHSWRDVLTDAVARSGGRRIAGELESVGLASRALEAIGTGA
jgi:hypothetical protein